MKTSETKTQLWF